MPEIKIKDIQFNSENIEKIYFEIENVIKKIRKAVEFMENSNLFKYPQSEIEKNKVTDILNDLDGNISSLNSGFSEKIEQKVRAYLK